MASIIKRRGPGGRTVWQARIERKGWPRQFRTFDSKAEARRWVAAIEGDMACGVFVSRTEAEGTSLAEALVRYRAEVTARKRGEAQERKRINQLLGHPLAARSLASIRGKDIADYIRERQAGGTGANTIRLDLALLSHLFTVARSAWGMESLGNPVALVKGSRPKLPRGRDRRLLPGEEPRLLAACEAYGEPIAAVMAIALTTAMRRGEIAAMRWEHLDRKARALLVPETKTGEPRRIPLSSSVLEVFDALPRRLDGYVFGVRADSITQAFGRAVERGRRDYEAECRTTGAAPDPRMLAGLRFHDLRHEATSRLFERGLNLMEVAAVTGHKALQMLKRYTPLRAEDLVDRLGRSEAGCRGDTSIAIRGPR